MTLMERALARAGYTPRFTEGYNPKPRLEFASPLGLGIPSREEIAAVDLHDFDGESSFLSRMSSALPPGIAVHKAGVAAVRPMAPRRSLMSVCWGAEYEVEDSDGGRLIRLSATGPSIRKTLEAEGSWGTARATRVRTFAKGRVNEPVSYFEAFCGPAVPGASSDLT